MSKNNNEIELFSWQNILLAIGTIGAIGGLYPIWTTMSLFWRGVIVGSSSMLILVKIILTIQKRLSLNTSEIQNLKNVVNNLPSELRNIKKELKKIKGGATDGNRSRKV